MDEDNSPDDQLAGGYVRERQPPNLGILVAITVLSLAITAIVLVLSLY